MSDGDATTRWLNRIALTLPWIILSLAGCAGPVHFNVSPAELSVEPSSAIVAAGSVSYTHLDVYKRQVLNRAIGLDGARGLHEIRVELCVYLRDRKHFNLRRTADSSAQRRVVRGPGRDNSVESRRRRRCVDTFICNRPPVCGNDRPSQGRYFGGCLLYTSRCV